MALNVFADTPNPLINQDFLLILGLKSKVFFKG